MAATSFSPVNDGHHINDDLAQIGSHMPRWRIAIARWMLSSDVRGDFYEQLGILLDAKSSEPDALAEIWKIATRNGKHASVFFALFNPLIVAIPVWIFAMVGDGVSLDVVMRQWIPRMEAQVLSAYCRRSLDGPRLYELAADARIEAAWASKVRAGAFPLLSAMLIVVLMTYLAATQFFPSLLHTIPLAQMSGQVRTAKQLSDFLMEHGSAVLTALGCLPIVVTMSLSSWTWRIRVLFDHCIWPYTLYREYTGVKWLRALSALLEAGDDPHTAIESMLEHATPYVAQRLRAVVLRDDLLLGDALASSGYEWPDTATISNITISMRAANPGAILKGIADRRMTFLSERMDRAADTASMGGTLAIGLFVIWITVVTNEIAAFTTQMIPGAHF